MKKFVIVVDAQNDFMLNTGALSVPQADTVITKINDYLKTLKVKKTAGVLFTFDTHDLSTYPGSKESEQFPPHCLKGHTGWNLAVDPRSVSPSIPVWKLEKNVFDMWEEKSSFIRGVLTDYDRDYFFNQMLKEQKIKEVEVVGVAADYCVKFAIQGLVDRNYMVRIPSSDLTKGISRSIGQVVREDFANNHVVVG